MPTLITHITKILVLREAFPRCFSHLGPVTELFFVPLTYQELAMSAILSILKKKKKKKEGSIPTLDQNQLITPETAKINAFR